MVYLVSLLNKSLHPLIESVFFIYLYLSEFLVAPSFHPAKMEQKGKSISWSKIIILFLFQKSARLLLFMLPQKDSLVHVYLEFCYDADRIKAGLIHVPLLFLLALEFLR